ncbi:MAG: hypothetical protein ACF8XB_00345 [Planctomycetota bacterium JB042]
MDLERLLPRLTVLHDRIRSRVGAALARGAAARGDDPSAEEARVAEEGAGDVTFAIDVPAEEEVDRFAEELAREIPLAVVSEGTGFRTYGRGDPAGRIVVDPIDGTRNLSHDMRSGWVLTALAEERGEETSLRHVRACVQSELPCLDRRSAEVLTAVRGGGVRRVRKDLGTGRESGARAIVAPERVPLDHGFFVFFKFSPEDRRAIAGIEEEFLRRLCDERGADRRTLYDDQYICNAGQLHLLATRRYRFVCDLRGVVGDALGVRNVTSKPYDVCCALIAEEAGCPLVRPDGSAFDPPLDVEHRISFAAYANEATRAALEPLLRDALDRFLAASGGGG